MSTLTELSANANKASDNDKSSITNDSTKLSAELDFKESSTVGIQHSVDVEAVIDRKDQHDTTLADTSINWLEVESQRSRSFSSSSGDDCSSIARNELKTNRDDYLASTNSSNKDRVTQKVSDKNMDSKSTKFYRSPESVHNDLYLNLNSPVSSVQRQESDQNRDYEENYDLSRTSSHLDDTTMMGDDKTMLSGSCLDSSLMPNTNKNKWTTTAKTAIDFPTEASQHHLANGGKDSEPPKRRHYLEWRQKAECDAFRSKFNQMVSEYEQCNPHIKFRDYKRMSSNDQQKEEEKVIRLLDRLGIRSVSPGAGIERTENGNASVERNRKFIADKGNSITMMDSPSPDSRTVERREIAACPMKQDSIAEKGAAVSEKSTNDFSAILLSPISVDSPKHLQLHENSVRFTAHSPEINEDSSKNSFGGFGQDDSSSLQASVEITRGAPSSHSNDSSLFESPVLEKIQLSKGCKRLATTSGKRGNDLYRTKLNDSSSGSEQDGIAFSSQRPWDSSDDSMSLMSSEQRRSHPFSASQSPIPGYSRQQRASDTNCSSENNQRKTERCRSEYSSSDVHSEHRGNDETIDSVDVTLIRDRQNGRQRLREIPANVALKDGVSFHYNPLHVKRSKRTSRRNRTAEDRPRHYAVDFSDPLCQYVGKDNEELYCIFEWMYDRDQNANSVQNRNRGNLHSNPDYKGIIFSLNQEQIINITIKLLIDVDSQSSEESFGRYTDDSSLSGQTLILVRDKDDVAIWERALREHTPFSVINHTSIPPRDKTRSAIAAKCATFDVVISTYDAAKSPDITTQIDDEGYAVSRNVAESQVDGWMLKRSGSSQTPSQLAVHCKQLSALHRITWRRIIFSDDLGRKSYLTKLGTSRAFAARALNSISRFAFFTKTEESDLSAFESLINSNKKAILSVASILRMELEDAEDGILDVIIDRDQGLR